jgi:acetylornithine/N-succinyldiaminopimelate aminotransferase
MSYHLYDKARTSLLETAARPKIVMARGQGMYLWDTEGRRYLDFVGGWAVNCLGHSPSALSDALADQAKTLVNASPSYFNIPMIEYAQALVAGSSLDRVFFCSTGAEANEGAIKLARKYGALYKRGAYEIITTKNGFHGRTLATMSATGKAAWERLFEPKVDGFRKSVFNDIDSVKALIGDNTCAVMIEPVQGEGGVHVADPDYIMSLRQVCDEHGILLIFDEIQTGMGRTGKLFCYEHYGIVPDIMTLGKGIGGGFPLSALLTREKLNIFDPGDQGGTYSGQPLAMAAGKAVLKALFDKKLVENAAKMGRHLINALHEFAKTYAIENIRGKGLLVAFDLAGQTGQQVVEKCIEHRLLINSPKPGTIRLMPPLIVSPSDVDAMLSVLEKVICKKTEA